jgi:hypothetical protein
MLQRSYAGRVFRPALMLFAGPWTGGASAGLGLVVNGCRPPVVLLHASQVATPAIAVMLGLHGCLEVSVMLIAGAYGQIEMRTHGLASRPGSVEVGSLNGIRYNTWRDTYLRRQCFGGRVQRR